MVNVIHLLLIDEILMRKNLENLIQYSFLRPSMQADPIYSRSQAIVCLDLQDIYARRLISSLAFQIRKSKKLAIFSLTGGGCRSRDVAQRVGYK